MNKTTWKNRILSLLLAVFMTVGVFPVQAFAEDGGDSIVLETREIQAQIIEEGADPTSLIKTLAPVRSGPKKAPAVKTDSKDAVSLSGNDAKTDKDEPETDDPEPVTAPAPENDSEQVVLSGLLPQDGIVTASSVSPVLDDLSPIAAYDIKIYADSSRLAAGSSWQPVSPIRVRIQNDAFAGYTGDLYIYHIADGSSAPEFVATVPVSGSAVEFDAASFSVYVVTPDTYTRTYTFYTYNEYGEYTEYLFTTESGESVSSQSIKNGESLTVPADPVNPQDPTATFAGWFEDVTPPGESTQVLSSTAYDFDHIPDVTQYEAVRLYAKFDSFAYVIYHDQQGSAPNVSFPVVYTDRVSLAGGSADVDISQRSVIYSGGTSMVFYGWSLARISTPGSSRDDEGYVVAKAADTITVTATTHLYPIFKAVNWLSFVSGPTGSGATYYPETYYFEGIGPDSLADHLPTRDGSYTFDGWYTEADGGGVKIANADGSLCAGASASDIEVDGGVIKLTGNVTLYANWTAPTTANYTVVIVKQKASDLDDEDRSNNTYEYSESFVLPGTIGDTVSAGTDYTNLSNDDSYNALHPGASVSGDSNPYHNYVYNSANSTGSVTVAADGSSILYVRYDWTTPPDMTDKKFKLSFVDTFTDDSFKSDDLPVIYDGGSKVDYGAALASLAPAPECKNIQAYEFIGWYVDPSYNTAVFLDENDTHYYIADEKTYTYASYPGSKALMETMPGADLTLYAGWTEKWYIVNIDPNYGVLDPTASTWFWAPYGGKIQEYTTTTRDYVESDSGTWYYIYHDMSGSYNDRKAYYTQDPSQATEFTTFEHRPGVYRYDGWYEVLWDGSEVKYDFSSIVDHDITIRLHWTKLGDFYLNYVAGEGKLNGDDELESVYVELDNDSYADNAEVIVTRSAIAPEGYEFTGWKIRGDSTETVYRPGSSFTLLTSYAVTVQGKKTVYLDAVYTKLPAARIVYHPNGGVITEADLDFGSIDNIANPGSTVSLTGVYDSAENTVTVDGLVNNSKIYLADGSGFSMTNATFAGWSNKPVYDPLYDSESLLFLPGVQTTETYNVDTSEPYNLYAVWTVDVNYHLNKDSDATFGGDWSTEGYVLSGTTYSKDTYLGSRLTWPPFDPEYTGSSPLVFKNWRTTQHTDNNAPNDDDVYGFDVAVTGPLDLYAYWAAPATIDIHVVDASAETVVDKDLDWRTVASIQVGPQAIDTNAAFAAAQCGNLPSSGYTFAFASLADSIANITDDPIASIAYSAEAGAVIVTSESGNSQTLDGESIYLVYYREKSLEIGSMWASTGGVLGDVVVSSAAPDSADLSSEYNMSGTGNVDAPLTYPNEDPSPYTYYSYAIGPAGATNTAALTMLTEESDSDGSRPTLLIRNTWRGFEYSTDGSNWESCGYEPKLYTIYYKALPTVVTISEKTFGKSSDMNDFFTYSVSVTQEGQAPGAPPVFSESDTLKSGESKFMTLFNAPEQAQTITVVQTVNPNYSTELSEKNGLGAVDSGTLSWTYTTSTADETPSVEFRNKHNPEAIEVHVAQVNVTGGGITLQDDLRSSTYSFNIDLDDEKEFRTVLAGDTLVTGISDFAMGAIFFGTDSGINGNAVTPAGDMKVVTISYEPIEDGSNIYGLYLKESAGEFGLRLAELSETGYRIYYLYYPKLTVHYLKEGDNGNLTSIVGASAGTVTYNGDPLTMNGYTIVQKQKVNMPADGLIISRSVGSTYFNMPPLLDDGSHPCDLIFSKIGVYSAADSNSDPVNNIAAAGTNFSEDLELFLSVVDNQLSWSFDGLTWTVFSNWPVINAVYRERGYDLTITKTVPVDTGYREPFTITVSSTAINRSSYAVEGTGSHTVSATPASGSTPGKIMFSVSDGSSVKLIGLGAGKYTVTETGNDNFTLTAELDTNTRTVTDNSTVKEFDLDKERTLNLTNAPVPICKVGVREFFTIQSAVEWIEQNAADFTGTIEMLVDYLMPSSDSPEISEYLNITLTSAGGTKTITRKDTHTSGPMFTSRGIFELQNVIIDGHSVAASGPIIANEGSLTVGADAVLRNAINSGNGGAISSSDGNVTIAADSSITGNKANFGGAVYVSGGTTVVSGGSISSNRAINGAAIYYAGSYDVTVSGGTISENNATNGGAIYMSTGTLKVSGGSISQNSATAKGGAVYSDVAVVNISDGTIGGSGVGNTAANGGAVYSETGSVNVSASAVISSNHASDNGGGVYVNTAVFSMTGGTLDSNSASVNGGAVYTPSGTITVSKGIVSSNTAVENGGGIYSASGAVNLSGSLTTTVFSGNAAVNGGAVYSGSGALSANKVTLTANTVSANGGAIYVDSGAATLTDCSIKTNSAVNGAGVFDNTGAITFSAGEVRSNTATSGGAVGVGSTAARLNFSGNIQVINNTLGSEDCNVYLDQDTDAIINAEALGNSAAVGIYVAGPTSADLFMHRGVPSARFGAYTSNSNLSKFSNDRLAGLSVEMETTTKKVYWGKSFIIEVRYVEPFTNFDSISGTLRKVDNANSISYFAPSSVSSASEIADDLRRNHIIKDLSATAAFSAAFVGDVPFNYDYNITDVVWDSANSRWCFTRRDGAVVTGNKLVVYFSEPYYISIENNTGNVLTVSDLRIGGQSAVNDSSNTGYGYVFARNGVIQDKLYPITAGDLTLDAGKSVKLLFPGGKSAAYSLTGSFASAAEVSYTLTGGSGNPYTITAAESTNFTLPLTGQPGTLSGTVGGTYDIKFGGNKAICKIVSSVDAALGYEQKVNGTAAGTYEYTFSTLNQAKEFITAHMPNDEPATIEMLVDYLIPGSDAVVLPASYDITFTTATTGVFQYEGTDPARRATISRDQGNNTSFIGTETGVLVSGDYNSKLTVKNLIFDGKAFGGESIEGGVIKTKGWNVEVDTVDFKNCQARYGGGIFIESVWPKKNDQTPYGYLTVSNSNFTNCMSLEGTDKFGGGGIWTSMKEMTITGCNFDSCEGAATIGKDKNAQGGAVFHFVANINASIETRSTVTDCTFDNCSANAAGSMECGAKTVRVTGCIFRNSTAKTKNGGALNIWVYDSASSGNASYVYVDGCTFENCYCLARETGSSGNGGAFRSTAKYNYVTNCTFTNTKGNDGGAINIFNTNAADTTISGCSFDSCEATSEGGAVYCASKTLTVDNYTNPVTGVTTDTTISNCYSKDAGGGIFHNKSANGTSLSISNTTIDNCKSTANAGGGVYSKAQIISLTSVNVQACTSVLQGGGLYLVPGNTSASSCIVTSSAITGNRASDNGGGLYYYYKNNDNNLHNNMKLTVTESTVDSNTSGGMGGGVYTNASAVTLSDTEIKDNTASGNGGGISYDRDGNIVMTIADGCKVTGNTSGGMGGGVYTGTNIALSNATITGNFLSHSTASSAAGVYVTDSRTITVGKEKPSGYTGEWNDTILIKDNTADGGAASDLRMPMTGTVNSNCVNVKCDLKGEIRVVNANKMGTQFGSTSIEYVGGFSDLYHVFVADDDSLYGIIDRADSSHKKIIWGMEPICKITDDRGRLLYLRIGETNYPAVFDYLDRGNSSDANDVSAFGIIRGHSPSDVKLFNSDGTPYAGTTYQVKMLVEKYTADSMINTPADTSKTIILTTAGGSDSLYPYRGRTGTRSTIHRGSQTAAMIMPRCNVTLTNVVLDSGSESGTPDGDESRIIIAETAGTTIRLGKNSALQNAKLGTAATACGAGVLLDNGAALIIEGGSIRNCSTGQNGGGVQVKNGNLTITSGSITRCIVDGNGGGVYFENGSFTMTGGSISRCEATNGAGVFIDNGKSMTMTGGSISTNKATTSGGGIAVGGKDSRLNFSGAAYVYSNTSDASVAPGKACNVQMEHHFGYTQITDAQNPGTVIHSNGLIRGATIGVYIPDGTDLFDKHGDIQRPFGTYEPGSNQDTLNYFINDRNALKGGIYDEQNPDNYMIYWVLIYSLKVTKQVLSDESADYDKSFNFRIELSGTASGTPAADYTYDSGGGISFVNGVAKFTLKSGESKTAEKMLLGFDYTVTEELTPEEAAYYKVSPGNVQTGSMNNSTQYLYEVTFNNLHAVCKVTDSDNGLLYYEKDGKIIPAVFSQLKNAFNALRITTFYSDDTGTTAVAANEGKTKVEMLVDYQMDSEAEAIFQNGTMAVLTTAEKDATDGFPYIGTGTTATISRVSNGDSMITVNGDLTLGNITFDGGSEHLDINSDPDPYTSTANGGILAVPSGGKLTVGTGTTIQNSNTSGNGAGIWLAEGALMNISGAPVFSNNISTGVTLPSGAKNGGAAYTEAKQDIYIARYGSADAASLAVTGNITSPAGSIWVWADQNRHYKESNQFAVMTGGTSYTGLNAFRNARTDTETGNKLTTTPEYLYGVSRGSDGKVYWAGTRELAITKTVTGEFSIRTDEFDFTVSGLKKDEVYQYKRYTSTNGSTWTMTSSGTFTGNSAGKVTFKLSHYQKIVIYVPTAYNVVVSENNGDYVPSYKIGTGSSVDGSTTTTIQMTNNAAVAFTNTMNAVAPTGFHVDIRPFALMLGIGAAMVMMAFAGRLPVLAAGGTGRGKARGKAKHISGPKHAKKIWRHGV